MDRLLHFILIIAEFSVYQILGRAWRRISPMPVVLPGTRLFSTEFENYANAITLTSASAGSVVIPGPALMGDC